MKKRFRRLYILGSVAAVALSSIYILPVSAEETSVYGNAASQEERESIDKDARKLVERLSDRDKQALKRIIDTVDMVKDYDPRVDATLRETKIRFATPMSYETFKRLGIDRMKGLTLKVTENKKEEIKQKLKEAFPSLPGKSHWFGRTCKMKNIAPNEISLIDNVMRSFNFDEIKVYGFAMSTYFSNSGRNTFKEIFGAPVSQELNVPKILTRLRTALLQLREDSYGDR